MFTQSPPTALKSQDKWISVTKRVPNPLKAPLSRNPRKLLAASTTNVKTAAWRKLKSYLVLLGAPHPLYKPYLYIHLPLVASYSVGYHGKLSSEMA